MKRTEIKRWPLSDTTIANLEPEASMYRVKDTGRLHLRVKNDGGKDWQLRYKKENGSWSFVGIGGYPNMTAKQARRLAVELEAEAEKCGITVMAVKQSRKVASKKDTSDTFEHLAREWHKSKRPSWTDGTATRILAALERHVFPVFGSRPFASITPMEWMEFLRSMEQTGIIEQTSRVRGWCRDTYDLARVTGRVTHNPIEGLHKFLQTKPATNYSHVSPAELPALLRAIRACPGAADVGIGLQLLSLLACRPSELRESRWCEFDLGNALWSIPADRMKRRREHLVPLPRQAVHLLQQLHRLKIGRAHV